MRLWGKLLGGAFGYMLGGPLGAILGVLIGHTVDKGFSSTLNFNPTVNTERVQAIFSKTTFLIMGFLAKADGRVSEHEIKAAQLIMDQMQLSPEQKKIAIGFFNEGKSAEFELDPVIDEFRKECGRHRNLKQMFLEILIATAMADGDIDELEREILLKICKKLGFSRLSFERLVAMIHAHQQASGGSGKQPRFKSIDDAYAMLGVEGSAADSDVKKAYRKLMSQHHPDKLVAKGLPEEMIKLATEKTQDIKAAFEAVKKHREMQ